MVIIKVPEDVSLTTIILEANSKVNPPPPSLIIIFFKSTLSRVAKRTICIIIILIILVDLSKIKPETAQNHWSGLAQLVD